MNDGLIILLPTLVVLAWRCGAGARWNRCWRGAGRILCHGRRGVSGRDRASHVVHINDRGCRLGTVSLRPVWGFIALLVKGGGSYALGKALISRIETKQGSLLATWSLGLLIFLDDYLNSLTVGATMKAVTDRFRTSRAMLAYVVDSTAAPLCLLVPLSSWGAYFSGLLEQNGVAAEGQGIAMFVETIPYLYYPMVALLIVPLVAMGVIPLVGAMRRAEELAERTGDLGVAEEQVLTVEEMPVAA